MIALPVGQEGHALFRARRIPLDTTGHYVSSVEQAGPASP